MNHRLSLAGVSEQLESLTDEERRALRGSRFNPLPAANPPQEKRSRLAHPGGPLATNKAAALVKFLKRKLDEPGGVASLDPALVERAVHNAENTYLSGFASVPGRVRHVNSFSDSDEEAEQKSKEKQFQRSAVKTSKKTKKKKKKKQERKTSASPPPTGGRQKMIDRSKKRPLKKKVAK